MKVRGPGTDGSLGLTLALGRTLSVWHLLWNGWVIVTRGVCVYAQRITAASGWFFFLLVISWWPVLWTWSPLHSSVLTDAADPSESLSHPLSHSCPSGSLSSRGMSSPRVALWLSSPYSCHILTHGNLGVQPKPFIHPSCLLCSLQYMGCPLWGHGHPVQHLFMALHTHTPIKKINKKIVA